MKRYVLDTNIILDDANIINHFNDAMLVIPITVLEELDHFKRNMDNLGRNARHFSNLLDNYRDNKGTISSHGVVMGQNVLLKVELNTKISPEIKHKGFLDPKKEDNRILMVALNYKHHFPSDEVIFLSKDTNLRIKADAMGITSENYSEHGDLNISDVYTGYREVAVDTIFIDQIYKDKHITYEGEEVFSPNEYAIFYDKDHPENKHIARFDQKTGLFKLLDYGKCNDIFGISPRNIEQRIAMDLLLNDEIKLVSLIGKAGTGKTLLAIAAGLAQSTQNMYDKLLVSRPIFPMGRDLGYLPGDVDEKLRPWMQPIYDNLEFILSAGKVDKSATAKKRLDELFNLGLIEVEPLTYIRGRSIPRQYMIIDEAQNLTKLEIKTIITRAGDNTKIVLTGDPYQIDQPYLDATNNGLIHVVEQLKDESITGTTTLIKGERSALARISADKL